MTQSEQYCAKTFYARGGIARDSGLPKPELSRSDLFRSCWTIAGWNDRDIELTVDRSTNS